MYYNFSLHSHSKTWILSFVLLVVSETRAFVFLIIFFYQDVWHVNFLAGIISTGEGRAWRWAPDKTSDS
jgi:hypothetical protein